MHLQRRGPHVNPWRLFCVSDLLDTSIPTEDLAEAVLDEKDYTFQECSSRVVSVEEREGGERVAVLRDHWM